MDDVAVVRRFGRYFTRRIGVLTDRYLGLDRPLGQARLLFEIGDGASLKDLRTRLGLDAGYLSRLVRSLEVDGLVRVSVHPRDSRLRLAKLTAAGAARVAEQDRLANGVTRDLLRGLTAPQRQELTEAITAAERLLRLAAVTIEPTDPTSPAARHCLQAFADELRVRFPEGFDESTDLVSPGDVDGSTGVFLVAFEEGSPVGCAAVRTVEPGVGEVRHVWVHAEARGLGLARRLMADLERWAGDHGLRVLRLGTHETLTEAIRMYRTGGWTEIPPYGHITHTHYWFEKRLVYPRPPSPRRVPG